MPDVNPFLTFLSLTIHQTTRSQTTFQKMDYSDALIDPNAPVPDELQGALNESGFTSKDIQEILSDIREAQGHLSAKPMAVKTAQPKPQIGFNL